MTTAHAEPSMELGSHEQRELIVERVEPLADRVVGLSLVEAGGRPLPAWAPGAHVDLLLTPSLERQYSLCGDPLDADRWEVAVLREPASRGGSEFVHSALEPGARIGVRGPRNHFELVEANSYVLIAGGIGITPLLPMAERLDQAGADWRLTYGGRSLDSMAFLDRLERFGDRASVHAEDATGLLDLDAALGPPRQGTAVYVCGPEGLIDAVEQRCEPWPAGALHTERFRPRPGALEGPAGAFDVELAISGVTIRVEAGQTIVEALEAAGFDVPTSCREGTCGTCETGVLEGEPDHRDSFLTPDEAASNEMMMICCSRSRSARLVLEL